MRVDEDDGLAVFNVLQDEIEEQRRFSAAGPTDDVRVAARVSDGHADGGAGLAPADNAAFEAIEQGDLTSLESRADGRADDAEEAVHCLVARIERVQS